MRSRSCTPTTSTTTSPRSRTTTVKPPPSATPPRPPGTPCSAARQAEYRGAVFEAARLWDAACASAELDPASTPADRLELALETAEALMRSGSSDVREKVVDAIDRAEALRDTASMARAARALIGNGTSWTWTDFRTPHPAVNSRLERTLAALGEQDSADRARLLGILALGVYGTERARCMELAAEARAIAERSGDDALRAECAATELVVLNDLEQAERRRDVAGELVDLADRLGRPEVALPALVSRIDFHVLTGALDLAQADHDAAEAILAQRAEPAGPDAARVPGPEAGDHRGPLRRGRSGQPAGLRAPPAHHALVGHQRVVPVRAVRHPARTGPAQ